MLDYLILGAGPAGLQLGYFLGRAGRSYRILEAGEAPGTFFRRFPRHRTLISSNKVFTGFDDPEINLRWDWNSLLSDDPELVFSRYSKEYFPPADAMLDYLADFARRHRLEISYDTRVTRVSRRRSGFVACAAGGGEHHARRLIVATGVSRSFLPAVPGIELAEPYAEVSIDRNAFENRRVLILGKATRRSRPPTTWCRRRR